MILVPEKDLVRKYFYQVFLPQQLPLDLIRSGNYLTLLGEGNHELRHLDVLGVPRGRVFSIEDNLDIFLEQASQSMRDGLGINLSYHSLIDYIKHHLVSNQRFLVMSLDVSGSYLVGVDPAMTEVLIFARRNPKTIVASYSNAGRDRSQLPEGLKSFVIFMAIAPEVTKEVANQIYGRYRAAGLIDSVSFCMVLRNFFWLRSHLEHILLGGVILDSVAPAIAHRVLTGFDGVWQLVADQVTGPINYGHLLSLNQTTSWPWPVDPVLDLVAGALATTAYPINHGGYHLGWMAQYQPVQPVTIVDWLNLSLPVLVSQPLRYARRGATALADFSEAKESIPPELTVRKLEDFKQPGRQLTVPLPKPEIARLGLQLVGKQLDQEELEDLVRVWARQGANTREVMGRLPVGTLSYRTITALIAGARRKPKVR